MNGQRIKRPPTRIDDDIKATVKKIIQGNEKRKRRMLNGNASAFDSMAYSVIDEALNNSCHAYLMIHKPWCDCEGNANELRKMADTLEAIEAGIWSIYEEHLAEGVTIEQIKELMEAETWLSGEEAAKYFNVSVGEENTAVAAVQDYTKLYCKNTPEALAGGNPPDDTKDQAAAKEKEIRSKIAALTIQHME